MVLEAMVSESERVKEEMPESGETARGILRTAEENEGSCRY